MKENKLIFAKHWQETSLYIKGVLKVWIYSEADRDDVLQNIALAAWKKFPSFDQKKGSFKNWALGITRFEYLKYLRFADSDRNVFDPKLLEHAERLEARESESIQNIYRNMEQCIEKLPEAGKAILKMKYYQKMSIAGIAESLGLSEAAVKQRLYRVKKELKACVQGHRKGQ